LCGQTLAAIIDGCLPQVEGLTQATMSDRLLESVGHYNRGTPKDIYSLRERIK